VIRYGYEGAFRLAAMARQEGLYGQTENLLEADSIPLPPELPQELQHLVSCAEYVAHSPDKRDAVRRDYETSNLTTNLLVQKHNIPENTLWRWAREGKWVRKIRLGVTAKRTGRLPEIDRCQKDLAFWLWCHSELPIPAIAARVKVSISTIKRWRRQHRRQYDNPVERAHWLYAETNTPIDDIAWRTGLDVRHLLKLATTHGWVRGEPITTVPAYSISPGFLRQLEGLSVPI
jgi:transposase-like protein